MSSCQSKPTLRLDWCRPAASRYACQRWHYSHTRPTSPHNDVGVWESDTFIGCVLFGLGATGSLGKPYGLRVRQWAELTRVAIKAGHAAPTSRIVAIAVRMIQAKNPSLRLLISFADPSKNHHGGIYQAMNWTYTGRSSSGFIWKLMDGSEAHPRRFSGVGYNAKRAIPSGAIRVDVPGKHRYLLPLDAEMRARIAPLAKPYPKRERSRENAAAPPSAEGGVIPTRSLQTEPVP